jgi:putative PIN family toxin of toxin-antitoxin system
VRIVLDTNVLISGIFFAGYPYEILDAWRQGRLDIATSPEILEEYSRVVLELAAGFQEIDPHAILSLIMIESHLTTAAPLPHQVCDDPDDDKFLACAIASGARIIVSGDKALRRVTGYQGISVLSPRDFVARHLSR